MGTYRDTELDRRHPLAEVARRPAAGGASNGSRCGGSTRARSTEFVAAAADQTLDDEIVELARAVHAETEGNPFFVGQMLRHLVESGAVSRRTGGGCAPTADAGLPEGVREVIGRRPSALDARRTRVLAVAAVIGREFDVGLLAETTDLDREQVLDSLELAETARLIEATPVHGGYTFVHALVRTTLYDEIPTTRRLRMHRRVASRSSPAPSGVDDALLPSLARHYCEAAALGEVDKAIGYATRPPPVRSYRLPTRRPATSTSVHSGVLEPRAEEDRAHRGELLIGLATVRGRRRPREPPASASTRHSTRGTRSARSARRCRDRHRRGSGAGARPASSTTELITLAEEVLHAIPQAIPGRAMSWPAWRASSTSSPRRTTGAAERRGGGDGAPPRRPRDAAYVLSCAHWGMWVPGNVAIGSRWPRRSCASAAPPDRRLSSAASVEVRRLHGAGRHRGRRRRARHGAALAEELGGRSYSGSPACTRPPGS